MPLPVQRFAMLQNPEELLADLEPTGERYVLAARVSGPVKTAFAEGIEGHGQGLHSADNINVIVVADSDILSDRMWVQVQDFLGNVYHNHGPTTAALPLMRWTTYRALTP